ncbi:MAG: hypothetical protein MJA30_13325 [Cytophagales bacterium]|nr:hypothetical protein [Cytophagales bacterium]
MMCTIVISFISCLQEADAYSLTIVFKVMISISAIDCKISVQENCKIFDAWFVFSEGPTPGKGRSRSASPQFKLDPEIQDLQLTRLKKGEVSAKSLVVGAPKSCLPDSESLNMIEMAPSKRVLDGESSAADREELDSIVCTSSSMADNSRASTNVGSNSRPSFSGFFRGGGRVHDPDVELYKPLREDSASARY